jgi:hypothetical protein
MNFLESKLFLFDSFFEYIRYRHADKFLTIIEKNLYKDREKCLLVTNVNPVKVAMILDHILVKI